jgi:hypothetical protein
MTGQLLDRFFATFVWDTGEMVILGLDFPSTRCCDVPGLSS